MSDELERTLDILFPLSRERGYYRHLNCPDTIDGHHGEPNVEGFCTWCGRKIAAKAGPFRPSKDILSDTEASYRYMYDPDFGIQNLEKY